MCIGILSIKYNVEVTLMDGNTCPHAEVGPKEEKNIFTWDTSDCSTMPRTTLYMFNWIVSGCMDELWSVVLHVGLTLPVYHLIVLTPHVE